MTESTCPPEAPSDLDALANQLYEYICYRCSFNGFSQETNAKFAKVLGVSREDAALAVKHLRDSGRLEMGMAPPGAAHRRRLYPAGDCP